jgi:hypothetical protein
MIAKKKLLPILAICIFPLLLLVLNYNALLRLVGDRTMVTLSLPPKDDIGINYYHESMDYLRPNDEQIERDLGQMLQVSRKIKVYHNPFVRRYVRDDGTSVDALEVVKNIVRRAKARHMYVVWTENDDSVPLTDALWDGYARAVVADAAEAQSVGTDEFLVGNEISNHNNGDQGYNDVHLPARIKQLVNECSKNFPGIKGYEEGWYKSQSWHDAQLGPVEKIYFTLYEPWHVFKQAFDQIVTYFGNKAEIGEASTMTMKWELHDDEQAWTRDLMRRYDYARQKKTAIWLFTFREIHNDGFGLWQANPAQHAHDIWSYLVQRKTLVYEQFLSNDFKDGTTQSFSGGGYNYQHRLRASPFDAPCIAQVSASDYAFRGIARPISTSGPDSWRSMRLVFRYNDENNYYFVNIEPNGNKVQLFKRQNGVETSLADVPTPIHLGMDYDFEIRIRGSGEDTSIQVLWNTTQLLVTHDPTPSTLTSGDVGIKNNGATGEISDVLVTNLES